MANPAFDAAAGSASGTFSHTNSAAGNSILVAARGTSSTAISAVTYGGVSLTKIDFEGSNGQADGVTVYGKIGGLPTGANNVVVTGFADWAGSISHTNPGSYGTTAKASGAGSNTFTISVLGTTTNGICVAFVATGSDGPPTATSPATRRFLEEISNGSASGNGWCEDKASVGGGSSTALAATNPGNDWWGAVALEIIPASGGVSGTGAISMKKMTVAGSGLSKLSITAAILLKKLVVSGTATAPLDGTGVISMKKLTVAGSGVSKLFVTSDIVLKKMTTSGSGISELFVTSAILLKKMVVSGTATAPLIGTGAVLLKKMTVSSSGFSELFVTSAITMNKLTVSGTATAPLIGTGAIVLKKMTVTGTSGSGVSGSGDILLKKLVVAGTATAPLIGTGAISLKKMTTSGSGISELFVTAPILMKKLVVAGTATAPLIGTAAILLKKFTVAGSGSSGSGVSGTGAISLKKMTVAGSGVSKLFVVEAATFKKMVVSGTATAPLRGTGAILLKKFTIDIEGPPPPGPSFNVGASMTDPAVPQSVHPTLTVPSGVLIDDLMIVGATIFGFEGDTGVSINVASSVSGHTWTQIGGLQTYDDGSLIIHGALFVRQATASDPGSTLTFNYTGTPGVDQKWWAAALASYTLLDVNDIDVVATKGAITSTSWPTPSEVTTGDDEWVIYVTPTAIGGSGTITAGPSGTTIRENPNNSGIAVGIADTNSSVGPAETTIGGGSWTSSSTGGWYTSFTLGVKPKIAAVPNTGAITMHKMRVAGTGNVTGMFSAVYNSSSGGVDSYDVTSQANGSGSHTMRVIVPTDPDPSYPHSFLYMLPVEFAGGSTFGDPIPLAISLDIANTYNTTIVSPGYEQDPWYADNPGDTTIQQETFTIWVTQWVKANLAITGTELHHILGFSKSGLGGSGLLFRHPDLFSKGAFWDTPADDNSYTRFGTDALVYGTQDNFTATYQLSLANLTRWAPPFTSTNRIWIAAGGTYAAEVSDWDGLLTSVGIQHSYDSTTFASESHAWHADWMDEGTAAIFAKKSSGHLSMKKMTVSGSGDTSFSGDGLGAILLKKMTVSGTAKAPIVGHSSVSLRKMTVSGTVKVPIVGHGSITLYKMTVFSSSGSRNEPSSLFIFSPL